MSSERTSEHRVGKEEGPCSSLEERTVLWPQSIWLMDLDPPRALSLS